MALSIKWVGSIHKTKGRNGFRPEAVVIHIMEGSLAGTDSWFNKPQSKVSAHYGIGKNGEIHQYVAEGDTAYHAGRKSNPTWSLIRDGVNPNSYTIGIEHEGFSDTPWTEAMYEASASLVSDICNRWAIPIDRDHIIGHREIYGVKTCPGNVVNLDKLVKMARGEAVSAETYNLIKKAGKVKTRTDLNLRKGAPTTMAGVVKKIPAGTEVAYVGWTSNGQNVNGNAHWYKDSND
ncbi:MAG TPA: peptidoglycan recognition family protein, partial [Blastocatellia bacterium]|nr:peptidoglycan recognition family protein [Blastocatellia bacterium]